MRASELVDLLTRYGEYTVETSTVELRENPMRELVAHQTDAVPVSKITIDTKNKTVVLVSQED